MAFFWGVGGIMTRDCKSKVVSRLEEEIILLRQLHLQAQTEMLALEGRDWDSLQGSLEIKENLIRQIAQVEKNILELIQPAKSLSGFFPQAQESKAQTLKKEGIDLVRRINKVEEKNRALLEVIRTDAMKEAQQLQQAQRVFQAYLARKEAPQFISRLVE